MSQIPETFPELQHIGDEDLRAGVTDAWETVVAETGVDNLDAVPWFPPAQHGLDIEDEYLVPHVRDVTACAVDLAETLRDRRDADISLDTVIAGALVHDVSKLHEFDGMEETSVGDLLGHPHYGVHVVARAGLPVEVAHIVLSHTPRTTVEPATLEAEIVRRADEVAAAAIKTAAVEDLRAV